MAFLTNAGSLAEEVSDILRHDNIDTMIMTWMSMVYDDISQRYSIDPFLWFKTNTIAANASKAVITNPNTYIGDAVCAIFVSSADGKVSMPKYRTMIDYANLGHTGLAEGSYFTGTYPLLWSIGPAIGVPGQSYLYVLPTVNNTTYCTIIYSNQSQQNIPDPQLFYNIPYCFEQVLVWGAVAEGAKSLNPQLYPIAKQEYEARIKDLVALYSYNPDNTPVMRSIGGPYMKTYKMKPLSSWPATIS